MADFRTASTVGARIASIRKMRGFKSTKDLADAIPGESITPSILQNIEAGRKNDLAVAQLLNLAWALRVSPLFILAPLGSPTEHLDLPNIVPEVRDLSVAEFDAWVSGLTGGVYRSITADEHSERNQLEALRELLKERRELRRLESILVLNAEMTEARESNTKSRAWDDVEQRATDSRRRITQLDTYLRSAGWEINGLQSS